MESIEGGYRANTDPLPCELQSEGVERVSLPESHADSNHVQCDRSVLLLQPSGSGGANHEAALHENPLGL
jgi:hypothetical protein